ncbi:MAG TPA: hypothetical protein VEH07_02895 [Alphaproteobacteria bacterium]|nr:hypothetical protein [Alphaproteobacteria bacterium]
MATITRSSVAPVAAEELWRAVHDPNVLRRVVAPLLTLEPLEPKVFPEEFMPASYVVSVKALGWLPLGRQAINISHPAPEPGESLPRYVLHDKGSGDLARVWDHRITIEPLSKTTCRLTDVVSIDAGLLTPLVALFVRILFRHRHRQLARVNAA